MCCGLPGVQGVNFPRQGTQEPVHARVTAVDTTYLVTTHGPKGAAPETFPLPEVAEDPQPPQRMEYGDLPLPLVKAGQLCHGPIPLLGYAPGAEGVQLAFVRLRIRHHLGSRSQIRDVQRNLAAADPEVEGKPSGSLFCSPPWNAHISSVTANVRRRKVVTGVAAGADTGLKNNLQSVWVIGNMAEIPAAQVDKVFCVLVLPKGV